MLTLAVDTTAEFGSIALADENGVREEVPLHAPDGFSGILFQEIQALLERQNVRLSDIDLFAGASGPGSFTGVRIGLAAIKGLAEVMGKPVAPVSNLRAVASFGTGELRAAIIDARRGEVFAALFDSAGNEVIAESVLPLTRFMEMLEGRPYKLVSAPRAMAAAIGRLALHSIPCDPALVEANYVRRSDAELLWKG